MTAVVSDLTRQELELAPTEVKKALESLPESSSEDVFLTEESRILAEQYIANDVVSIKHVIDAQHIALATVAKVDLLVSWNFQHIVNMARIRGFNSVNLKLGYQILEIRSPREVVYGQDI